MRFYVDLTGIQDWGGMWVTNRPLRSCFPVSNPTETEFLPLTFYSNQKNSPEATFQSKIFTNAQRYRLDASQFLENTQHRNTVHSSKDRYRTAPVMICVNAATVSGNKTMTGKAAGLIEPLPHVVERP